MTPMFSRRSNWNAPTNLHRLSFFDYFVTESGVGGNLNVCMVNIGADGSLNRDFTFPAVAVAGEQRNPAGSSCISFNRADWPEPRGFGAGPAKPHYGIFAGRLGPGGCGDGECTGNENCSNCPADCGCTAPDTCQSGECKPPCGDGTCGAGENCSNCPEDCGCTAPNTCQDGGVCRGPCGDGRCDPNVGETCGTCATDCGACTVGCCQVGTSHCFSCDNSQCASAPGAPNSCVPGGECSVVENPDGTFRGSCNGQ